MTGWLLREILNTRRAAGAKRTYVGFLDGESAYCRPPHEFILEELWATGIDQLTWRHR